MEEYDYFNESVPDGISNAIDAYDENLECCGQDGYEILVKTFGSDVCGGDLKSASEPEFKRFASAMQEYFELSYLPTADDAKSIIHKALLQWGG